MRAIERVSRLWRPTPSAAKGRLWLDLADGGRLQEYLSAIPSETSLAERLFLYGFAKEMATAGDIVELGPFLGGTTRALALGVTHSQTPDRKVITIDQFNNYCDASLLRRLGVASPAAEGMVEFLPLFESLHGPEPYYRNIRTICLKVSDSPGQAADYSSLGDAADVGSVFIDGCKSWYSVKEFVSSIVPHCARQPYFLFQDYGRYTCFWIPVFVESFQDHFEFVGSVESTHVFRLRRPLDRQTIDERYTDEPAGMSREVVDSIFAGVCDRERKAGRWSALVTARIQWAAYYAYVGETTKAEHMLRALRREKCVRSNLRRRVDEALISPTYSPTGRITL